MYFYFFFIFLFVGSCSAEKLFEQQLSEVNKLLITYPFLHIGYEIYSLKQKTIIAACNQGHIFTPGSTTKLFTAIYALDKLGPDYAFETDLLIDGSIKKGILHGDLIIKGSGDPSLTTPDLEQMFMRLAKKGIRHITGNIYIDNGEFDEECYQPGCCLNNLGYSWNNPVRAFIVDRQVVGINEISTVCFMKKNETVENLFLDAERVINPALSKAGIIVDGDIALNETKKGKKIISHRSAPLKDIIKTILKESDNLYSDCLFKKIGAINYGTPGTWLKGMRALQDFISNKLKIERDAVLIFDGSGKSRYNLFSPHHLMTLLSYARGQRYFPLLFESLPISSVDGSLQKRMRDIPYAVRAKTGSMYGATSLAGYARTEADTLEFVIMVNGDIDGKAKTTIEDAFCSLLVK
jgi:serine-type D-Ala-D-Ala carboxypeptidase/endopeptidase (penicillin-binding protein 4)